MENYQRGEEGWRPRSGWKKKKSMGSSGKKRSGGRSARVNMLLLGGRPMGLSREKRLTCNQGATKQHYQGVESLGRLATGGLEGRKGNFFCKARHIRLKGVVYSAEIKRVCLHQVRGKSQITLLDSNRRLRPSRVGPKPEGKDRGGSTYKGGGGPLL